MCWEPGMTMKKVKTDAILDAYFFHGMNKTHAARALGLSLRTVRQYVNDYYKNEINWKKLDDTHAQCQKLLQKENIGG